MRVLTGQGIGDSVWSLFKIQDIFKKKGSGNLDLLLGVGSDKDIEKRSLNFMRRFPFLHSVDIYPIKCLKNQCGPVLRPGPASDEEGRYNYIPDGPVGKDYPVSLPGIDWVLVPNHTLERGVRTEDWLPEFETDWTIYDKLRFTPEETKFSDDFAKKGPYAILYFGPENGNTKDGHNRGQMWTPDHWRQLTELIAANAKLRFVVIGATYDMSYWEKFIQPKWGNIPVENYIGQWEIGTTMAILKRAKLCVAYQSGLAVSAHHFGVPVVTFWREKGNSISARMKLSFEESMATNWGRPQFIDEGRLLPVFYGRHDPERVFRHMKARKWFDGPTGFKLPDTSEFYDEAKAVKEEKNWEKERQFEANAAVVNSMLRDFKITSVLELGCGSGWLPSKLQAGTKYTGIDANPHFIAMAQKKCKSVNTAAFLQMDIRQVDSAGLKPDLVCMFGCLKHFALTEIDTLLAKWMTLAPRMVFNAQLSEYDFDNGTEFHHTYLRELRIKRIAAKAGKKVRIEKTKTWMTPEGKAHDAYVYVE